MATVSTAYPAQLGARSSQRNPVDLIGGEPADNDGGVVVTGGTVANSRFTAKTVASLAQNNKSVGSAVFDSAEAGHVKARSQRTFGLLVAGQYIIPKVTTTLGGEASTAIQTNGNVIRNRLNFSVKDYATLVVTKGWDYTSGQHPSLPSASTVSYPQKDGSTTTAGTVDKVTLETPAAPGRITFKSGGSTAVSQDYSARNSL